MSRLACPFRTLLVTALAAVVAVLILTPPAHAQSSDVSFQTFTIPDGDGPAVEVGVWYPAGAAHGASLPLVVMSHGTGGAYDSHRDTSEALARAGFIAAALTHTGDNWRDQSRAVDMANRPRQLKVLTDYLVSNWSGPVRVNADRIGAFGFSSGGFTVLAAAGGQPNLARVAEHCRAHPMFFDCQLVGRQPPAADAPPMTWTHDTRIRAVVSAAPALGYTFDREGLTGVIQPVQLWRAEIDHVLPHPFYAQAVADALPTRPEYHVVARADHFDFLPPCSARLQAAAPVICEPTPGFDRAAFHDTFNRDVVAFFQRTLAAR